MKNKNSSSKHLVCHKNAIKKDNGSIVISEKCDACGLCKLSCCKALEKDYDRKIEKPIFSDLGKLNIFLSNVFPDAFVATEVKTEGHFRQKRIDAVVRKNNAIALIKVLTNVDKYNFYHRSYEEVMEKCRDKYPEMDISIIFMALEVMVKKARTLGYDDVVSIDEIKSLI